MDTYQNSRYDYILIWGHGIKYRDDILSAIRDNENFDIVRIQDHIPRSIEYLVKKIYSYDYAPFEHLKQKTKYLKTTPNSVIFVFIKNNNPCIDYWGVEDFRHIESLTLKKFKDQLRDKFNPRINNIRTEDHVIHASDNELQTDYILKYLGINDGVDFFKRHNNFLDSPYFIPASDKVQIKKVDINNLYCNILEGSKDKPQLKTVQINDSPQYAGLSDMSVYSNYIKKYIGGPLKADYSIHKYIELSKQLNYLFPPFHNNYIIAKIIHEKLVIIDGLHRAAILKYREQKNILIAIID
ncbi:hypothetical protein [Carboxylicivirga caseinilyticus]|uniref:hypothetical protein n=1 Tax=Carboxylicivirga caseinilyticus TaxID=3417572 RepID=UPI003D32692B|nr:hypothetical protein [Marinilabiliaceae bacterium A049]